MNFPGGEFGELSPLSFGFGPLTGIYIAQRWVVFGIIIYENIGLSFQQKCFVTLKMRQIRFRRLVGWGGDAPFHSPPRSMSRLLPQIESCLHHCVRCLRRI